MAERTLNDICIIAKQAGLILREGYEKSHDIKQKTRQDDLVTEMDKKSEDFILERLGTLYPDDMIVTEETGTHTGDAEHVWYIDPCDGTMNYAHGLPLFAVSIGYAYKGELTMGVVYDPMRDECFYAEKGRRRKASTIFLPSNISCASAPVSAAWGSPRWRSPMWPADGWTVTGPSNSAPGMWLPGS